jgi:hypothetical protein
VGAWSAGAGSGVQPSGRARAGATQYYFAPGWSFTGATVYAQPANTLQYWPLYFDTSQTIDQLALEVTTAAAGGTFIRAGIFSADLDWQPTSLVTDAGTVAADTLGVKTFSVSQPLIGRYLGATISDGAPTLRSYFGTGPGNAGVPLGATFATSPAAWLWRVARAFGPLPATGDLWTTTTAGASPLPMCLFCRIATP